MPSNISGRTNANTIVNINTVSCNLPLVLTSNNNTSTIISLSNLNSYGTSNQILKMNSDGTALEYSDETDTQYSAGSNISISNSNVISNDLTNNNCIINNYNEEYNKTKYINQRDTLIEEKYIKTYKLCRGENFKNINDENNDNLVENRIQYHLYYRKKYMNSFTDQNKDRKLKVLKIEIRFFS